jgi:hypothetical protein
MRSNSLAVAMAMLFGFAGRAMQSMKDGIAGAPTNDGRLSGRGKSRKSSQRPSGAAAQKRASKRLRNIAKHPRSAA